MRIDAAKVGVYKVFGDFGGNFRRTTERHHDAGSELPQRVRCNTRV
jgi:hypothetical protein